MSTETSIHKGFIHKEEWVGYGMVEGRMGHDIRATVIGREFRGWIYNLALVQTYVRPTGNEQALRLISGAHPHQGWSGDEFEIDRLETAEVACKLTYSPESNIPHKEDIEIYKPEQDELLPALPLVANLPLYISEMKEVIG